MMKISRLLPSTALLAALWIAPAARAATQVYSQTFASAPGSEWSFPLGGTMQTAVTDTGRPYLGPLGGTTARLYLQNLPAHSRVTLSFQLFILNTEAWGGNGKPSTFDLSVDYGGTLLHTTFGNTWDPPTPTGGFDPQPSSSQAYPGTYPGASNPPWTGKSEFDSLSLGDPYSFTQPPHGDAVYNLSFTFAHSGQAVGVRFSGPGLTTERWGITQVVVSVDSEQPVTQPGDKIGSYAVFRPDTGEWFFHGADGAGHSVQWGGPGDVPVPADYLALGQPQIAVYRPSTGEWYIRSADGKSGARVQWGGPGDVPIPGDYLGLGRASIAVFRPSTYEWIVRRDDGSGLVTQWGTKGDVPLSMQPPAGF